MRHGIEIRYPDWVAKLAEETWAYPDDRARMRLAIRLARENITRATGGPFGAAVFERDGGRLISLGMNLVLPFHNSILHAEIVALMMAQDRLGMATLASGSATKYELVSSCEPCAMCLGAIHWSRVSRLVTGATKADVESLGFDEGPVFPESWRYVEEKGLTITREVCREEAGDVLELYRKMGGQVY